MRNDEEHSGRFDFLEYDYDNDNDGDNDGEGIPSMIYSSHQSTVPIPIPSRFAERIGT